MALRHRTFWVPKGGNASGDCEDAAAADPEAGRFAVADGASEGAFIDTWARLLVERFAARDDEHLVPWEPSWLSDVRRRWLNQVQHDLAEKYGDRKPPYYIHNDLRRGASATFLGLVVAAEGESYRWRATAVGDTCLFHTRGGKLRRVFPVSHSSHFGNRPPLLASWAGKGAGEGVTIQESGEAGDRLWLATDALAHWCMVEEEGDRSPWQSLECLLEPSATQEQFRWWIERLRTERTLQNDDVTLLIVAL